MKIIDLLNKIANEEEMPKKIRVKNHIWAYEKGFKQYKNDNFQELLKFLLGYYKEDGFSFTLYGALNCEVELIEDEIDIDNINAYKLMEAPYMAQCLRGNQFDTSAELLKQSELEIVEKINKLVDKVNLIGNKIKEKE